MFKMIPFLVALTMSFTVTARANETFCDRTPQLVDWVVRWVNIVNPPDSNDPDAKPKTCKEINPKDLLLVTELKFDNGLHRINAFKASDFLGMTNLKSLNMSMNTPMNDDQPLVLPLEFLTVLVT